MPEETRLIHECCVLGLPHINGAIFPCGSTIAQSSCTVLFVLSMRPHTIAVLLLLVAGCEPAGRTSPSAGAIVDSAIAAHGSAVLDRAVVSFRFRGDRYRLRRDDGQFHYYRRYTDSLHRAVQEGLTNNGPYRVVEGDTLTLSEEDRTEIDTAVNSVAYFALLPYPLQDPSVQTSYDGRDTLSGTPYHRIRITFRKEDGGSDWQDVFLHWIRTDNYTLDYLAYAYGLGPNDPDTGTRFRAAYNVRRSNGVRFADYRNYTVDTLRPAQLHDYPDLRAHDALSLVSNIELDSIQVRALSPDA